MKIFKLKFLFFALEIYISVLIRGTHKYNGSLASKIKGKRKMEERLIPRVVF